LYNAHMAYATFNAPHTWSVGISSGRPGDAIKFKWL
jgi:hypothetical protein